MLTPGDAPDVLVAMNPAALKANIKDLKKGGILIVNSDAFRMSRAPAVNVTDTADGPSHKRF